MLDDAVIEGGYDLEDVIRNGIECDDEEHDIDDWDLDQIHNSMMEQIRESGRIALPPCFAPFRIQKATPKFSRDGDGYIYVGECTPMNLILNEPRDELGSIRINEPLERSNEPANRRRRSIELMCNPT